ncbi:hypothetical protein D0C36_16595 [Mucilaginibacter conchicola]|uniref:Uncharacterized protein n=1 Tax=Mucilaginibacter conchicola TaxID=2303333 RepID=A0A372NUQ7_9SPHI|nr:hypothetical protein [Mucilaginibacter conchicola]RFZ93003.1 hypothetical protein D0C36_16595 [Mucilaginibacter conchicola]
MPNIRFNYLYRDGGNYKIFGNIVFKNHLNLPLQYIQPQIVSNLIDETWFYAEKWKLPILYCNLSIDDPTWHEFESIEYTKAKGTTDISEFLQLFADA